MTTLFRSLALLSTAAAIFFGTSTAGVLLRGGFRDGYTFRMTFVPLVVALASAVLFTLASRKGHTASFAESDVSAGLPVTAGGRVETH